MKELTVAYLAGQVKKMVLTDVKHVRSPHIEICTATGARTAKQMEEWKTKSVPAAEAQNENDNNNAAAGVQLFDMPRFAW